VGGAIVTSAWRWSTNSSRLPLTILRFPVWMIGAAIYVKTIKLSLELLNCSYNRPFLWLFDTESFCWTWSSCSIQTNTANSEVIPARSLRSNAHSSNHVHADLIIVGHGSTDTMWNVQAQYTQTKKVCNISEPICQWIRISYNRPFQISWNIYIN
jgi:hypothetical protein